MAWNALRRIAPSISTHQGTPGSDIAWRQRYHPRMRRLLPPQQVIGLLVAGLLCLMAAGFAVMRKYGPARGHFYAVLQQHR